MDGGHKKIHWYQGDSPVSRSHVIQDCVFSVFISGLGKVLVLGWCQAGGEGKYGEGPEVLAGVWLRVSRRNWIGKKYHSSPE